MLLSVLLCYYYKNRGKLAIYFIYLLLLLLLFIFVVGQRGPAQAWAWDSHRVTLSLAPALCQGWGLCSFNPKCWPNCCFLLSIEAFHGSQSISCPIVILQEEGGKRCLNAMGQNYYLFWNLFPLYKVWVLLYVIYFVTILKLKWGFPGGSHGKQHSCQCRRHNRWRFHPRVRKIPRRRAVQPTPVFLLGESHG